MPKTGQIRRVPDAAIELPEDDGARWIDVTAWLHRADEMAQHDGRVALAALVTPEELAALRMAYQTVAGLFAVLSETRGG